MDKAHEPCYIQYRTLSTRAIRLLRIDQDDLSLETTLLDAAPVFYALSHCWGTGQPASRLEIGGETLAVRPELAAGVARLRRMARGGCRLLDEPLRYIWIDTICINQGDPRERSCQVQLMGEIYAQSVRTLIWLGTASWSPWGLLDRVFSGFEERYPYASDVPIFPSQKLSDDDCSAMGLPAWTDVSWGELRGLLELPWFTRLWVIQEVIRSRQDPLLMLGEVVYLWHRLGQAVSWLSCKCDTMCWQAAINPYNVIVLFLLRQSCGRWPLDVLIYWTHLDFDTSDPRDKIYGLLGLAEESADPAGLPAALCPDYTLDVAAVYARVTRFFVHRRRSLAVLYNVQKYGLDDLPSWVPDLRCGSDPADSFSGARLYVAGGVWRAKRLDYDYSTPHYAACHGLPPLTIHEADDDAVLTVDGVLADEVAMATSLSPGVLRRKDFRRYVGPLVVNALEAAFAILLSPDGDNAALLLENFIRCTTMGKFTFYKGRMDDHIRDGCAYLHDTVVGLRALSCRLGYGSEILSAAKRRMGGGGGIPGDYENVVERRCFRMVFLVTKDGRMGVGPEGTRAGDVVAVIRGGKVPHIVRRREDGDDTWTFVGQSYVDGLMDGSVVADIVRNDPAAERPLRLR